MEFDTLGKHCHYKGCNQKDYLPFQCDACHIYLCREHAKYDDHECKEAHKKNNVLKEPRKCEKLYKNKCDVKNCKRRELIPVTCTKCKKNYCFKHRHTQDHQCDARCPQKKMQSTTMKESFTVSVF